MNPYAQQKSGSARWVTRLAWSLFPETIKTCARADVTFWLGQRSQRFSHMYASQSWLGGKSDALSWDNLSPYERDLSEGGWVLASVLLHVFLDLSLNSAVADPAEGPGGERAEPLNQTEARRAEKKLFWRPGSPLSKGLDDHKVWIRYCSVHTNKNKKWAKEPNIPPSWSLPNAPVCAKKRQREPRGARKKAKYLLINCRECKPHFTVFNTA